MVKNQTIAIVVLVLIGSGMFLVYTPLGNQIMDDIAAFFNIEAGSTYNPSGDFAPQKWILTKRGTATAIAAATVYAGFDWNSNGLIDLGEYPDGEIETLTSAGTTGLVTTALAYPVGEEVFYQVHASTYEVEVFSRTLNQVPSSYDGSALSVPACYVTLTDTGATRISLNGELLVTSSTDYNYTLSGSEPSGEVVHTATSTDAGINEQAYVNWGTGKIYAGTFLGVTMTNQDYIDLRPDGFDGIFIGATNTYIWWFVDGYFNDADVTGDERYSMFFNCDISDAGDFAIIGMYNGVETSDLAIGSWTTVLGTSETDIDIVA